MPIHTNIQAGLVSGLSTGLDAWPYGSSVPLPSSVQEWQSSYPAITAPVAIHTMQDATAPAADSVGSADLSVIAGTVAFDASGYDTLGGKVVNFTSGTLAEADAATFDYGTASFSVWLRVKTSSGYIASKFEPDKPRWFLLAGANFRLQFNDGTTAYEPTQPANDAEWHDLLVVRDSADGTISLFVDGTEYQAAFSGAVDVTNSALYSLGWPGALTGQIRYHAVFDYAITAEQWAEIRSARIQVTLLTSSTDSTDGTSVSTGAISPASGSEVYAFLSACKTGGIATTPTCSGAGLSWELVTTTAVGGGSGDDQHLYCFHGTGTPSSGALTFDFGAETIESFAWTVVQAENSAGTGNVATGTATANSISATPGAIQNGSVHIVYIGERGTSTLWTPDPSFVSLATTTISSYNQGTLTQWSENATATIDAPAPTNGVGWISIEIKKG